eukprot:TRINITY_DN7483_c1_g1_i1.p1 TRINITY_DN7483_c1_g1~~TRINITY_DN7483_c1_g1_i1.p1  ORF type:complete len:318 (-),score=97.85 TRINITY_DN7483_c1_g1_i1:116-985(-)
MLQEIDELFEDEIGAYLERLRLHNAAAKSPALAASERVRRPLLARGGLTEEQQQATERQLAAVRRLAVGLKTSVLERLVKNPDLWTPADDEHDEMSCEDEAVAAEEESAVAAAAERCRLLREQIEARRAEELRLREEVAGKLHKDSNGRVRATADLLEQLRADIVSGADGGDGTDGAEGTEFRKEFAEYARSIRANLESAWDLAGRLEQRRLDLDAIGRQQRIGPAAAERLLERDDLCPEKPADRDRSAAALEDQQLVDAISRGEQVCHRMRRIAKASSAGPQALALCA